MIDIQEIEKHKYYLPKNSMNKEIMNLYLSISQEKWDLIEKYNMQTENGDFRMTNPYLITVSDSYYQSSIKVMIVCKETYGSWGGEFGDHSGIFMKDNIPQKLMSLYDLYTLRNGDKKYGPWNLLASLRNKFSSDKVGFIMNNLHFIGYLGGRKGTNYNIEDKFQSILKKEIEICKPDIILFCIGHGEYNNNLRKKLGGLKFEQVIDNIKSNFFAKVLLDNPLQGNPLLFRTYHPHFLLKKMKRTLRFAILDEINSQIQTLIDYKKGTKILFKNVF